jgi:LmbE family N-acetylglucosaminyl deacetylase
MHPYRQFVHSFVGLARLGSQLPLGGFAPLPRPDLPPNAPRVLLFSPHPDDECVIGALPLRLLREAGLRVVNVAVTLGSNQARQSERLKELERACGFLGFDLLTTAPSGLERVNRETRHQHPEEWAAKVKTVAGLLEAQSPRAIVFPHDRDWNSTHVGVHWLVADALQSLGPSFECYTVETEFWGQCDDPNLVVESSEADVADLIAGLSFHEGEVRRNPYHVLQPTWMMDNVRRGAELVGGQGAGAPSFTFATLYRLRRWQEGGFRRFYTGGRMLPAVASAASIFAAGA